MRKFMSPNVGQFVVEGNLFPELNWETAKLSLSCFISKRLAKRANEVRCEKCSSQIVFNGVCVTCTPES